MFPLALLIKPVIDLIVSFVKPLAIVGIAIFVDIALGLGITDWAIAYVTQYAQNYIVNSWGNFV